MQGPTYNTIKGMEMKQIAITKKQHEAVIRMLLNNLCRLAESNRDSAARHYKHADACEKDTLGYLTEMSDGDKDSDRSRKLRDAICLIAEITGIK